MRMSKIVVSLTPTFVVAPTEAEMNNALTVLWRSMVTEGDALQTHDGTVNGEQVCIFVARGEDAAFLLNGIGEAMDDDDEDESDDEDE